MLITAPNPLQGTATDGQMNLTWAAVTGAGTVNYDVYKHGPDGTGCPTDDPHVTVTTTNHSELVGHGKLRRWCVTASAQGATSPPTDTRELVTAPEAPTVMGGVGGPAPPRQMQLVWDPVESEADTPVTYQVYRAGPGGTGCSPADTLVMDFTQAWYVQNNGPAEVFRWCVTATADSPPSAMSNTVVLISAPQLSGSVTGDGDQVTLDWSPAPAAAGASYRLYRRAGSLTCNDFSGELVYDDTGTSATVNVGYEQTYQWCVYVDAQGATSPRSNQIGLTTGPDPDPDPPPDTPTISGTAYDQRNEVRLTLWPSGADTVRIRRTVGTACTASSSVVHTFNSTGNWVDRPTINQEPYRYCATAHGPTGTSPVSATIQLVGQDWTINGASAGQFHTCAEGGEDGNAYCWGWNAFGQLSVGDTTGRELPTLARRNNGSDIPGGGTAGTDHSCFGIGGQAWCAGNNQSGQLGIGSSGGIETTAEMMTGANNSQIIRIDAGSAATCVIRIPGTREVWCVGRNDGGRFGTHDANNSNVLTQGMFSSDPVTGAAVVRVGEWHACVGFGSSKQAHCAGVGEHGQLGDGWLVDRNWFRPVYREPGDESIIGSVNAGAFHTCGRTVGGEGMAPNSVLCWGLNEHGQANPPAGSPNPTPGNEGNVCHRPSGGIYPCPILVGTGMGGAASAASTGRYHSCAVEQGAPVADREIRCWGRNNVGQLGNGSTSDSSSVVTVMFVTDAVALTSGPLAEHTCVTRSGDGDPGVTNSSMWCWGSNSEGQLGNPTLEDYIEVPTRVLGPGPW